MEAFAGIDVAFAKKKYLPISVCVRRDGTLEPLFLRKESIVPPRGHGNAESLNDEVVREFAESSANYLRDVEKTFKIEIRRIAIDAPSAPRSDGLLRREAEKGLDKLSISCITTPDTRQFTAIRAKAQAHHINGGEESRLPHANQLWMLVGFELFRRLRKEWECLEVYPQAIAKMLGSAGVHKSRADGLFLQLSAVARFTGWPKAKYSSSLKNIGYGSLHDKLDAYLAAWVASLDIEDRKPIGNPPDDAIWVPSIRVTHGKGNR